MRGRSSKADETMGQKYQDFGCKKVCHVDQCKSTWTNPVPKGQQWVSANVKNTKGMNKCCASRKGRCNICCPAFGYIIFTDMKLFYKVKITNDKDGRDLIDMGMSLPNDLNMISWSPVPPTGPGFVEEGISHTEAFTTLQVYKGDFSDNLLASIGDLTHGRSDRSDRSDDETLLIDWTKSMGISMRKQGRGNYVLYAPDHPVISQMTGNCFAMCVYELVVRDPVIYDILKEDGLGRSILILIHNILLNYRLTRYGQKADGGSVYNEETEESSVEAFKRTHSSVTEIFDPTHNTEHLTIADTVVRVLDAQGGLTNQTFVSLFKTTRTYMSTPVYTRLDPSYTSRDITNQMKSIIQRIGQNIIAESYRDSYLDRAKADIIIYEVANTVDVARKMIQQVGGNTRNPITCGEGILTFLSEVYLSLTLPGDLHGITSGIVHEGYNYTHYRPRLYTCDFIHV